MRYAALLLTLLLCCCAPAFCQQNGSIKGAVYDTINRQPLSGAVVLVLQVRDSTLTRFIRTNAQGLYELKNLAPGRYLLQGSYPGYAGYSDVVDISDDEQKQLPPIVMLTREKILETVIVQQKLASIRMKGDTIEYRADSFSTGPNASVQDLLKRLPGIQVNSKGEITAQGQKVEKILVDGEEFFSDDPAVVAENLRADAVDRLQVFDKKSDQAAFTGIDDGQTSRTINLELKAKARKGYFGKAEAGTDFRKYYSGKLLANVFRSKQKIAGYLSGSNTQFQLLNWEEREKYSTDADRTVEIGDNGSMYMYSNEDEFNNGEGLPRVLNGGIMYSNKWNEDKNNLNLNYQMNDQLIRGSRSQLTQTILPDTSFTNRTTSDFESQQQRHRLFGTYDYTIDSTSSLKITARGTYQYSVATNRFAGETISQDGRIINNSTRQTTGKDQQQHADLSALYRKKFHKTGRTLSLNTNSRYNYSEYDGLLRAGNNFFDKTGNPLPSLTLDQKKVSSGNQASLTSRATYTEPLWKKIFLELNAAYAHGKNNAERNTLEQSSANKYDVRIDSLSNHFLFNTRSASAGTSLRYAGAKLNLTLGTSLGRTTFVQQDLRLLKISKLSFRNFLPSASIEWKPSRQRRLSASYKGSNTNPSLYQIQPVIDNSDPLNLVIGNPGLRQSFVHQFNTHYSDYKVLRSRNIYISLNGSMTDRQIATSSTIDSQGRRITQYVNVNGVFYAGGWMSYGLEPLPGFNLSFNYNPSVSRYVNLVNGLENSTLSQSHGFGLNSGYWGDDKPVHYWVNVQATRHLSRSSINPQLSNRYWSYDFSPNITLKHKKVWELNLEANLQLYQRTRAFSNQQDFYIVNTTLKRILGAKKQYEILLEAHDIFNQNIGFSRSLSTNFITENRWQTIQRYVLLKFACHFTRQNGQHP